MNHLLKISICCATMIMLIACKKSGEFSSNNQRIIVGDPSGMIAQTHNTTITAKTDGSLVTINIDVDKDGKGDNIYLNLYQSSCGATNYSSLFISGIELECVVKQSPSILYSKHIKDSIYPYHHSSQYTTTAKEEFWLRSCMPITDYDRKETLTPFWLIQPLSKDAELGYGDQFALSTSLMVWQDAVKCKTSTAERDTFFVSNITNIGDCNSLLTIGEEKYIGLKLKRNNKQCLGWIKLKILNSNQVLLMESAIQP